jgi:thioredoxin-like negative regulator of GroEL
VSSLLQLKNFPPSGRITIVIATRPVTLATHDHVLSAKGTAVLVFMADQNRACQKFRQALEQVAERYASVPFYMADSKKETELARLHHVRALPMSIFYRDGNPIRRVPGVLSADELTSIVDEVQHADMRQEIVELLVEIVRTQVLLSPVLRQPANYSG